MQRPRKKRRPVKARRPTITRPRPAPVKEADRRYAICPSSGFDGVHGALAVEITRSGAKRKPTAFCVLCRTRIFFGEAKVKSGVGLTREKAKGYGAVFLDEIGG